MKYDIKPEELERIRPASSFSYRVNLNDQISAESVSVVRNAVRVLEVDSMKTEVVYAIGNNDAPHRMVARRAVRIARRKGYHARWQVDGGLVQLVIGLKPLGIPAPSDGLCIGLFCGALVVGVIMVMLCEAGIL